VSATVTDALRELEALRYDFSPESAARKLELLQDLDGRRLPSAEQVLELHQLLGFVRALPETIELREQAQRMAETFEERPDLRRFRKALADTGIAGTNLNFRFYWLTAIWLLPRWAEQLTIDWKSFENRDKLVGWLHLLVPYSESPALDSYGHTAKEWINYLKGPGETDAGFVMRRFEALPVETPLREKVYEDLDIPIVLAPGKDTPAKGRELWRESPVVLQTKPPARGRPNLKRAIPKEQFTVTEVDARRGRQLIDLADACMVTRHRDLLIFLNADKRDVRMIDFGDGLQFACMGAVPERRLMLEAVYGFLTLMNGVPIGYVLCSAFFGSAEIAYNVFDNYRGAGAAHTYARVLAMVRGLFGVDTFAVDPYQLGHDNREGMDSGAWWFYYKLGFRSHDPAIKALVREELATMKADPGYRTPPRRIHDLAAEYMYLHLGKSRRDVLGMLDLGAIGMHVTHTLANRAGGEREQGIADCADETAKLLGQAKWRALPKGERLAWERWAPLVLSIPDVSDWSASERHALREVVRAKGGPRESTFVTLFDKHTRLRQALLRLAATQPTR